MQCDIDSIFSAIDSFRSYNWRCRWIVGSFALRVYRNYRFIFHISGHNVRVWLFFELHECCIILSVLGRATNFFNTGPGCHTEFRANLFRIDFVRVYLRQKGKLAVNNCFYIGEFIDVSVAIINFQRFHSVWI